MSKFKYITYVEEGFEKFIMFDRLTNHSDFRRENILGAGFATVNVKIDGSINFHCFGKSLSLGVVSREELDELIINECYREY